MCQTFIEDDDDSTRQAIGILDDDENVFIVSEEDTKICLYKEAESKENDEMESWKRFVRWRYCQEICLGRIREWILFRRGRTERGYHTEVCIDTVVELVS